MITLWGRSNSHNVKKPLWLLEELGISYVRHDVGGPFGMDEVYHAKNPNGLIPTLEDGDLIQWESNSILRYLAARYGDSSTFWPADPAQRAIGDKWMDWQIGFGEKIKGAYLGLIRTPEAQRDHAAISASAEAMNSAMQIIENMLESSEYLSGDALGLGDIAMGVFAYSYYNLAIDRPALPMTERWFAKLQQRPAYQKSVMIPLS
ncbi:MAG: glutathione S-transferase [Sphingobium sp.]|nr:glutathione S-transferase [Sphingobium sp.]